MESRSMVEAADNHKKIVNAYSIPEAGIPMLRI
jgi:hypothetical protein